LSVCLDKRDHAAENIERRHRCGPRPGDPALPRHRLIVALGFRIAGWVVGIPALLASVGLGVGAVLLADGPSKTPYMDDKTYGLLGVLINGVHAVTDVVAFIGAMAGLVLTIFAVLGVLVVLFAVLLYLIGRGLKVRAAWARVLAGLVSLLTLANAAIVLSALNRAGEVVDGAVIAGSLYVLWTLIWRFADPPSPARTSPAG
jgi:hypothetical protein